MFHNNYSPDIRTAIAKVDQARSELAYVAGQKLPKVYKAAELQFRRDSQNDGLGTTVLTDIPGVEIKDTPYMFTGVVAQWEIDLFGRIRRAVESSTAQYQASIEEYRGVRVSLAAEIADKPLGAAGAVLAVELMFRQTCEM